MNNIVDIEGVSTPTKQDMTTGANNDYNQIWRKHTLYAFEQKKLILESLLFTHHMEVPGRSKVKITKRFKNKSVLSTRDFFKTC